MTSQNGCSTSARRSFGLNHLALLAALAIASCAAPAAQAPTSLQLTAVCPDNTPFVNSTRVRHLAKGGFRFQTNGYDQSVPRKGYRPPTSDSGLTSARQQRLNDAFLLLTKAAQADLCAVSTIFVDDDPDDFAGTPVPGAPDAEGSGWAFWEVRAAEINKYPGAKTKFDSSADQGDNTYVGIAGSLVDNNTATLAGGETNTITGLLKQGGNVPAVIPTVSVTSDGPELAVAAMLLHELGHLTWHHYCFPAPTPACAAFRKTSWYTEINWPPTGIHALGGDLRDHRIDGGGATGINDILQDSSGGALLAHLRLTTSKPRLWTSLMAGIAPDEDFAETYKFTHLAQKSIKVTFTANGQSRNADDLDPTKAKAFAAVFVPSRAPSAASAARRRMLQRR